jgi:hypothetical protein
MGLQGDGPALLRSLVENERILSPQRSIPSRSSHADQVAIREGSAAVREARSSWDSRKSKKRFGTEAVPPHVHVPPTSALRTTITISGCACGCWVVNHLRRATHHGALSQKFESRTHYNEFLRVVFAIALLDGGPIEDLREDRRAGVHTKATIDALEERFPKSDGGGKPLSKRRTALFGDRSKTREATLFSVKSLTSNALGSGASFSGGNFKARPCPPSPESLLTEATTEVAGDNRRY